MWHRLFADRIVFDSTLPLGEYSVETCIHKGFLWERRVHAVNFQSVEQEWAMIVRLWDESIHSGQKIHIPDITSALARDICAQKYQDMGYFDTKTRSYIIPLMQAPVTVGTSLFHLIYSRQNASMLPREIHHRLRQSGDTRAMRAGVNEGLFVTIEMFQDQESLVRKALSDQSIPWIKAYNLLYQNWIQRWYRIVAN